MDWGDTLVRKRLELFEKVGRNRARGGAADRSRPGVSSDHFREPLTVLVAQRRDHCLQRLNLDEIKGGWGGWILAIIAGGMGMGGVWVAGTPKRVLPKWMQ